MAYNPEPLATVWTRQHIEEVEAISDEIRQRRIAEENAPVQIRIYLSFPVMVELVKAQQHQYVLNCLINYLTSGALTQCPAFILTRIDQVMKDLPLHEYHNDLGLKLTNPRQLSFTLAIRRVDAENINRRLPLSIYSNIVSKIRITALNHDSETQRSESAEGAPSTDHR